MATMSAMNVRSPEEDREVSQGGLTDTVPEETHDGQEAEVPDELEPYMTFTGSKYCTA